MNYVDNRGSHQIYYFIPPEIVKTDYVTNCVSITKLEGGWVFSTPFSRILSIVTNGEWDDKRYYDTYLHPEYKEESPKCPHCGKPLVFRGLSHGYSSMVDGCAKLNFCSQECSVNYRYNHPEDYQEFTEFMNSGGAAKLMIDNPEEYPEFHKYMSEGSSFGMMHRDVEKYGLTGFRNPKIQKITSIENRYTHFLNMGDPMDQCVFYIATDYDGNFKFGVTSDLDIRSGFSAYRNSKAIFYSTRKTVAMLEKLIKYELDSQVESMTWNEVHKFRKAFNKCINLIDHQVN